MTARPPRRPWWRRKRWWAAIVLLVLWLMLPPLAVVVYYTCDPLGPAIPPWKEARLHVGMPAGEVRELLGDPELVERRPDGSQRWVIDHGTLMGHYIEFDANGRLVSHWEDE